MHECVPISFDVMQVNCTFNYLKMLVPFMKTTNVKPVVTVEYIYTHTYIQDFIVAACLLLDGARL